MPTWTECTLDDSILYVELLRETTTFYAQSNMDEMKLLLGKRQGRAFVYQDEEAGFYFLLSMVPGQTDPTVWKMVHAIPGGLRFPRNSQNCHDPDS
ncbi:MAG: hypothetical protein R3C11_24360 [Planctomycetaceae bacterium]